MSDLNVTVVEKVQKQTKNGKPFWKIGTNLGDYFVWEATLANSLEVGHSFVVEIEQGDYPKITKIVKTSELQEATGQIDVVSSASKDTSDRILRCVALEHSARMFSKNPEVFTHSVPEVAASVLEMAELFLLWLRGEVKK